MLPVSSRTRVKKQPVFKNGGNHGLFSISYYVGLNVFRHGRHDVIVMLQQANHVPAAALTWPLLHIAGQEQNKQPVFKSGGNHGIFYVSYNATLDTFRRHDVVRLRCSSRPIPCLLLRWHDPLLQNNYPLEFQSIPLFSIAGLFILPLDRRERF